jgi:hypothetical protein
MFHHFAMCRRRYEAAALAGRADFAWNFLVTLEVQLSG